ncbi:MotA/TolQ/ExbB proton channel family protein [Methylobacter psychrophilus]|uniref:MotA/TolQ/ExbB proton channel family protein n=1 Tax=Methylobacter psychrophilus TaxID=96941 RepID=UPI002948BA17|nr:MotA/TolQ/ExbB proton channel family protein [Methylobacter psychrophilus]
MTETTSAAAEIPQAATQTPLSGSPISGTDIGGAAKGAATTVADAAPAATNLATSAADIAPAAPEITSALIVDATLWILIAFSAVTWALILIKGIQHLRISHHNRVFSKKFWGAEDFQAASALQGNNGPAARVAEAGFATLLEADGGTTTHDLEHTGDRQELLDRRLRQQMQKERSALEGGLAILATVGSISPFVGLFGTVWGIMGALTSISKSGSASLDVVAGPIGEALVATAVGIAVAVPAVIGYNFFIRRNKVIWAFLDDFSIDFVHLALKTAFLIKRQGYSTVAPSRSNESITRKSALKTNHDELQPEGAQI